MNQLSSDSRSPFTMLIVGLIVLLAISLSMEAPLGAQVTDEGGFITSSNWLVLGPFSTPFECTGDDGALLGNELAPTFIGCEYPEEGDEIDYEPEEATSTSYIGPGDDPHWRRFDDFSDDRYLDLDADATFLGFFDRSSVVSWLVTYIEWSGSEPAPLELCLGSDDAVQVWLDDRLVQSHSVCRPWQPCQDLVDVLVEPGIHRIAVGVWESTGDWGFSLALRQHGEPIDRKSRDWIFLGADGEGYDGPEDCGEPECLAERVTNLQCRTSDAERVGVSWRNPQDGCMAERPIRIAIDGETVAQLAGDVESVDLRAGAGAKVCVTNASGRPLCCTVPERREDFGAPVFHAPDLDGGEIMKSGSMTEDGLTLYYDVWSRVENSNFICVARRESRFSPFAGGRRLGPEIDHPAWETRPAISPDGRMLFFSAGPHRGGAGKFDLWAARKDAPRDLAAPFEDVFRIEDPDVNTFANERMGCVSFDGEELFFTRDWQLWTARFVDPGRPEEGFAEERNLAQLNIPGISAQAPSVSSCGRYLFWSDRPSDWGGGSPPRAGGHSETTTDAWVALRDRSSGDGSWLPFTAIVNLPSPVNSLRYEVSPWISYDGRSLLVTTDLRSAFQLELIEVPIEHDLCRVLDHPATCPESEPSEFVRGECNGDARVDVSDAVCELNWLLVGGPAPGCVAALNTNGDHKVDITDSLFLLTHLFIGGPPPVGPYPDCGPGVLRADGELGCADGCR